MSNATDQRNSDILTLRTLCELEDETLPDAMYDILEKLEEGGQYFLTGKQRKWVNDCALDRGIELTKGPEDDGAPKSVRLSDGPIPRGAEVELMVRDKPLKPPQRISKT